MKFFCPPADPGVAAADVKLYDKQTDAVNRELVEARRKLDALEREPTFHDERYARRRTHLVAVIASLADRLRAREASRPALPAVDVARRAAYDLRRELLEERLQELKILEAARRDAAAVRSRIEALQSRLNKLARTAGAPALAEIPVCYPNRKEAEAVRGWPGMLTSHDIERELK